MLTVSSIKVTASIFDALLMIKDQVPMSDEIQHIIDFISASKLGIIK